MIKKCLMVAILTGLLLIFGGRAQAQTETVLYNFTGSPDGAGPQSQLSSDGVGNFYGTTFFGGLACSEWQYGCGTVYELSPNGNGGWNQTVLYRFTGGLDGSQPDFAGVILDRLGNLYGTTFAGGTNGEGVVFELSPAGANWTETVLYNFGSYSGDGANPVGGLAFDTNGNLYGTTENGGSNNLGTVFELSPSDGTWAEQVIYESSDFSSVAGVTIDATGNIFGTTETTVFEVSRNGQGGWTSSVIHEFTGKGGYYPAGALAVDSAGNLYGTTYMGGPKNYGLVYKLTHFKKKWKFQALSPFYGGKKAGSYPCAGIVFDASGNIYGTTLYGGTYNQGTVFELVAPVGRGSYKQTVLWSFNGTNGGVPFGSLILEGGTLYGTGDEGGPNDAGVVFGVTP